MTDTSKDKLNQLESRIENMLDKLIEIDEDRHVPEELNSKVKKKLKNKLIKQELLKIF